MPNVQNRLADEFARAPAITRPVNDNLVQPSVHRPGLSDHLLASALISASALVTLGWAAFLAWSVSKLFALLF